MRSSDITKHTHGWIRPDGKFFACGREEHLNLLDDLGVHYTEADKKGWIKIGSGLDGQTYFFPGDILGGKVQPSQAQINAMDKFCAARGIDLPWWAGGHWTNTGA